MEMSTYALRKAIGLHMLERAWIVAGAPDSLVSGTNGMDPIKYVYGAAGSGLMVSGCRWILYAAVGRKVLTE